MMKWIALCSTTLLLLGLTTSADAGLFDRWYGDAKCCDADCAPECCAPTIVRPCHTTVHCYDRQCADAKPRCCDTHGVGCCAPCCQTDCCDEVCCDGGKSGWRLPNLFGKWRMPSWGGKGCCDTACCDAPCCECCGGDGCCADPCELARLIYRAQTACYASDRARAIDELGDEYCCQCNPEIMTAFVYALNDCDERVRCEAADEIGDQIESCPCCCTPCIVGVLKCALADCDRGVRRQAEEALEACGYCIVDGCCRGTACCDAGCDVGCGHTGGYAVPHGDAVLPPGAYDEAAPGAVPGDLPADAPPTGGAPGDLPQPAADEPPARAPSVPSPSANSESGAGNRLARLFGLK
jgi:hypothetical protein